MKPPRRAVSALGWCLLRFPILPAYPHASGLSDEDRDTTKRLFGLALDYVASFQRTDEHDQSWRGVAELHAMYDSRARHRATPFGIFAVTTVADVADGAAVTHVDLDKDLRVQRVDLPTATDRWFVNPTLMAEGGRWCYLPGEAGGVRSASDSPILRTLAAQLSELPRDPDEWARILGGRQQLNMCSDRRLLLPVLTPTPLLEPDSGQTSSVEPVTVTLTKPRPFATDQYVETFSEVRTQAERAHVDAMMDGVSAVLGSQPQERLRQARDYLADRFTGGAVPLTWLLSATVDHPLGSWRRPERAAQSAAAPRYPSARLFVPAKSRHNRDGEWLTGARSFLDWRREIMSSVSSEVEPGAPPRAGVPRFGMAAGTVLASPRSGADVWLKAVAPGLWAGPGARLGDQLRLPCHDESDDAGRVAVELGWTAGVRATLARRRAGRIPRLNIDMPRRPGDLRIADLAVVLSDGLLQLVVRGDGRIVELRFDSPLVLSHADNPWVVQLLGLLAAESGQLAFPSDPLSWLASGSFVPRLTVGRCLVSRRGVSLDARHRSDLVALAADPDELCASLTGIGLGHVVELTEYGDSIMRVDLSDSLQRRWFTRRMQRNTMMHLHESLPVAAAVESRLGRHVHELWVPWTMAGRTETKPISTVRMVDRLPEPDPTWASWHVYAPDRLVEHWLARPEVLALMDQDRLFFIRYRDDRPHLRVRMHRQAAVDEMVAQLRGYLAEASPHHPSSLEPHEWIPEDCRYGGVAWRGATLRHFCADSAWWTRHFAAGAEIDRRLQLAVIRIATWCVELAGPDALDLLVQVRGIDPSLPSPPSQRAWMQTYRSMRMELEDLMAQQPQGSAVTLGHLAELDGDARQVALYSLIHMTINRGLPGGHGVRREPEIVMAAARLLKSRALRTARQGSSHV
jgi:thiopeptide-type bacteriocin biosynthesis protein